MMLFLFLIKNLEEVYLYVCYADTVLMKIVFIRHGEPDKTGVDERGFIGQGRYGAFIGIGDSTRGRSVCQSAF